MTRFSDVSISNGLSHWSIINALFYKLFGNICPCLCSVLISHLFTLEYCALSPSQRTLLRQKYHLWSHTWLQKKRAAKYKHRVMWGTRWDFKSTKNSNPGDSKSVRVACGLTHGNAFKWCCCCTAWKILFQRRSVNPQRAIIERLMVAPAFRMQSEARIFKLRLTS